MYIKNCRFWGELAWTENSPHKRSNFYFLVLVGSWPLKWWHLRHHNLIWFVLQNLSNVTSNQLNFWVEVMSLHVSGRPEVLDCMPSVWGLEQCNILCMHWNGPKTFCTLNFDLKSSNLGDQNSSERNVRVLWCVGEGLSFSYQYLHPPFVLYGNSITVAECHYFCYR